MSDQNPYQENVESTADQEVDTAETTTVEQQSATESEQPKDELSLLREQLEAAEAAAGMAKDELLRVQAEMQNLRRRT